MAIDKPVRNDAPLDKEEEVPLSQRFLEAVGRVGSHMVSVFDHEPIREGSDEEADQPGVTPHKKANPAKAEVKQEMGQLPKVANKRVDGAEPVLEA